MYKMAMKTTRKMTVQAKNTLEDVSENAPGQEDVLDPPPPRPPLGAISTAVSVRSMGARFTVDERRVLDER